MHLHGSRPRRRSTGARALAGLAVSLTAASFTTRAAAEDVDGVYGRLDGDVAVTGEASLVVGGEGAAVGGRLAASYLTMSGVYLGYEQGLGMPDQSLARRWSAGIELRPAFMARFLSDLERGPALLDLWLDSIGVNLGAYLAGHTPSTCPSGCQTRGVELSAQMALPLLGRASAPFVGLRGGVRVPLEPLDAPEPTASQGFVALTLGHQHLVSTGLLRRAP
jgi:hypothetical protein